MATAPAIPPLRLAAVPPAEDLDEDEHEALPGEVIPRAICCFAATYGDFEDMRALRATLAVPVAIQGMVVAVVEVDNPIPGEPNVDLEYVGIEGYAYVPPGHEPVPPDHRL